MDGNRVEVKGLADLRRELKKLDNAKELNDALRAEHQRVAQIVVDRARVIAGSYGPQMVRAAESISAGRTVNGAVVRAGGARDPWALAAMFGTKHNIQRTGPSGRTYLGWNQFKDAVKGGYTIYPAIERESDRIVEVYGDGIDRITRAAFPS